MMGSVNFGTSLLIINWASNSGLVQGQYQLRLQYLNRHFAGQRPNVGGLSQILVSRSNQGYAGHLKFTRNFGLIKASLESFIARILEPASQLHRIRDRIASINRSIEGLNQIAPVSFQPKTKFVGGEILNATMRDTLSKMFPRNMSFSLLLSSPHIGQSAPSFDSAVNGKGPFVTVLRAGSGHVFGVYLPEDFASKSGWHPCHQDLFLFARQPDRKTSQVHPPSRGDDALWQLRPAHRQPRPHLLLLQLVRGPVCRLFSGTRIPRRPRDRRCAGHAGKSRLRPGPGGDLHAHAGRMTGPGGGSAAGRGPLASRACDGARPPCWSRLGLGLAVTDRVDRRRPSPSEPVGLRSPVPRACLS